MADEPETTTDAGTVTDETPTDTTDDTAVTDTSADDSAGGDDGAVDDDAASQDATGKTNVPYSRFKNVNERRKAAELENAELKGRLAALEPKREEAKTASPKDRLKGVTPADPTWTPAQQLEHYALETLEKHPEIIDRRIKELFGMDPAAAAATLSYSKVSNQRTIRGEFEQACREHGLDPANEGVQNVIGGAMDTKKFRTFGEAMDAILPKTKSGTAPKKVNGKGAESDGVDVEGLSRVKALPKDAREAGVLAAQGKQIELRSVTDILKGFGN